MSKRTVHSLLIVGVLCLLWFLPVPAGLTVQAWHTFAIFVATILGFILSPVSNGIVAVVSLVFSAITKTIPLGQLLSGSFGNNTIWLVVSAFFLASGFIETGLGRRIAFLLAKRFGDSSLKLAYSLAISDLFIGPTTPSNTARAGGVLFPIVSSICAAFESKPGPTAKKLGSFLMLAIFHTDIVVCTMFLTAMAGNPLMAEFAKKTLGVEITWTTWFIAALVPGLIAFVLVPYLVYLLCPPELKKTPEVKALAAKELEKMGSMSLNEKIMLGIFITCLGLWATAGFTNLNATLVALMGVALMLVTGVLSYDKFLSEGKAWDALLWMGYVIGLASAMNTSGFIKWFADVVSGMLAGTSAIAA
ncbi:MAG: DASS family sodium-coupled anion symporter, partial [Sporomusa sp.]